MRSTLAVGRFGDSAIARLESASQAAGLGLTRVDSIGEALDWASDEQPHSLLINGETGNLERDCFEVRSHARHALVPIVALSRRVNELAFAEAFNSGGDDVVPLHAEQALTARLRRLPESPWARPESSTLKIALIAASDRARRVVLARVLGNAGHAIQFAVGPREVREFVERTTPRLVVIDAEEGVVELTAELAPRFPHTLWIVSAPPRHMRDYQEQLSHSENAAVTDAFAPPENVVFLANELGRGQADDQRSSRRLLYGTLVAFRCAGRDEDDHGLSYNVSEGGLYVRSLAPPAEDRVWLELTPPRTECRVRLEARVCWRRAYGPSNAATVPPGFGLEITDGARADRAAWLAGYQSFAGSLGG